MASYAWLALDLFAVLVFFFAVRHCAARGFVGSFVSFFGFFAAAAVARLFSAPLAGLFYEHVVRDALRLFIADRMESAIASGGLGAIGDAAPFLLGLLMQGPVAELPDSTGDGIGAFVGMLIDTALKEPAISLTSGVLFFILFSLSLLVIRRFSWLLGGLGRLPLIGPVNTTLGGVVGIAAAAMILYVAGIGLKLVVAVTGGGLEYLNSEILDATFVFRVFL